MDIVHSYTQEERDGSRELIIRTIERFIDQLQVLHNNHPDLLGTADLVDIAANLLATTLATITCDECRPSQLESVLDAIPDMVEVKLRHARTMSRGCAGSC